MVWDQIGLRVPRFESRMHSQHQRLVINQESRGGKSLEGIWREGRRGERGRGYRIQINLRKTIIIMML